MLRDNGESIDMQVRQGRREMRCVLRGRMRSMMKERIMDVLLRVIIFPSLLSPLIIEYFSL